MGNHSDRGSARVPGGYGDDHYGDYGGGGYGDGRHDGGRGSGWDDYDYSDPRRNHAEPTSGRASVRVGSLGSPEDDYGYEPPVSGRATVGDRPAAGRAKVTGPKPKLTDEELAEKKKLLKKKKRKLRLIIMGCVVLMVMGMGTVGWSLYYSSVDIPGYLPVAASSTIKYAGGEDMGGYGTEFHIAVPYEEIPPHVKDAIIAAEDNSFRTNPGVDFKGILRAVWNNVTGGETQGASTITQQYAGLAMKFRNDISYGRKIEEAVIAMKLDDNYTKDEILGYYMDSVYFGRSANGIGAAAEAFFDEDVRKLNECQAALLAGQIKSPNGYYDPRNPEGQGSADTVLQRYTYVLGSMVGIGAIDQAKADECLAEIPETSKKTSNQANYGAETSTGFVSHGYVIDELEKRWNLTEEQITNDPEGYKIVTTIDKDLQKAAVEAASSDKDKGKVMPDEKKNLAASLVAIDPNTGEVLAYYGGDNGTGVDKAGLESPHSMGSSFKIFTVSAAIDNGYGMDSLWDGSSPREFERRKEEPGWDGPGPVYNSGDGRGAQCPSCTLTEATRQSLNTPMYAISDLLSSNTIVDYAHRMGIEVLRNADGENVFLGEHDVKDYNEWFDNEVSFGQYPTTTKNMATGAATLANEGTKVETHFIKEVIDLKTGEAVPPTRALEETPAIAATTAWDVTDMLSTIHPYDDDLNDGRPYAGKTGTWERDCTESMKDCDDNQNSNTSYIGYIPQLAAAAWVGDKESDNGSVTDTNGTPIYGGDLAGSVWAHFMNKAIEKKDYEQEPFPPAVHGGSKQGDAQVQDTTPEDTDPGNGDECHGQGQGNNCDDTDPTDPDPTDPDPGNDPPVEDGVCDWLNPDPADPDCQDEGGDTNDPNPRTGTVDNTSYSTYERRYTLTAA